MTRADSKIFILKKWKKMIYRKHVCNNPENEDFDNSKYGFEGLSIKIILFVIRYSDIRLQNLHFEHPT